MAQSLAEDLSLSCVPRGSTLGPILFNLFISDLDERADASSLGLLTPLSWEELLTSQCAGCAALQKDCDRLEREEEKNHLKFNKGSCTWGRVASGISTD